MTPDGARWMDATVDTAALDEMLKEIWRRWRPIAELAQGGANPPRDPV
jgi:hypothetical protein